MQTQQTNKSDDPKPQSDEVDDGKDPEHMSLDDLVEEDDDEETRALVAKYADKARDAVTRQKQPDNVEKAKSNLTLDLGPESDETDWEVTEKAVRAVALPGMKWLSSNIIPIAYGIRKLRIQCQLIDSMVAVDDITDQLQEIEGIRAVDIFAFEVAR